MRKTLKTHDMTCEVFEDNFSSLNHLYSHLWRVINWLGRIAKETSIETSRHSIDILKWNSLFHFSIRALSSRFISALYPGTEQQQQHKTHHTATTTRKVFLGHQFLAIIICMMFLSIFCLSFSTLYNTGEAEAVDRANLALFFSPLELSFSMTLLAALFWRRMLSFCLMLSPCDEERPVVGSSRIKRWMGGEKSKC